MFLQLQKLKCILEQQRADDARSIKELVWTPFNDDGSPDTAVTPRDDETFREHKFSVSDLPSFTSFQLKIVLKKELLVHIHLE